MVRSKVQPSNVLGDRYRILRMVGKGGMGNVYLAEDLKLSGKQWAVKETYNPQVDYQMFMDEADIMTKLSHPHLPRIVDYYPPDSEGYSYVVMDFIEGQTLQDVFIFQNQRVPYESVMQYALQLCDLFHYLHNAKPEPIIYRDLKPSNIMIGDNDKLTLIDFGIARNYKEGKQTDTVQIGTIGFAAPEQFEDKQTDRRTDMYTLGALLYYLLSGGQYYYVTQASIESVRKDLPVGFIRALDKLLQYDPQERYQSAYDLKMELEAIIGASRALSGGYAAGKQIVGTVVIAVIGASKSVGVTHTAITMANYLAGLGLSVALVEKNSNQHFGLIEAMYEGVDRSIIETVTFEIKGVTYYKNSGNPQFEISSASSYSYVIYDLGYYEESEEGLQQFARSHVQIVVGAGIDWKQPELLRFRDRNRTMDARKWNVLIPFVDSRTIRDIRKGLLGVKVTALPVHPDPYVTEKPTDEAFDEVLQPYLVQHHHGNGAKKGKVRKLLGSLFSN